MTSAHDVFRRLEAMEIEAHLALRDQLARQPFDKEAYSQARMHHRDIATALRMVRGMLFVAKKEELCQNNV